jgi:hypothetical protein
MVLLDTMANVGAVCIAQSLDDTSQEGLIITLLFSSLITTLLMGAITMMYHMPLFQVVIQIFILRIFAI